MTDPSFTLRPGTRDDVHWMAELRARVMRPDLERLGRFDPDRVRTRFTGVYDPSHTKVVSVGDEIAGLIAVRPESDTQWIEHFYLAPEQQGHGLGGAVLASVLSSHRDERPFRLNVLRGSAARRLYARHGFVFEHGDDIDEYWVEAASKHPPRPVG